MKSQQKAWILAVTLIFLSFCSSAQEKSALVLMAQEKKYDQLLDSLRTLSLQECNLFFSQQLNREIFSPCEQTTLTRIHATILSERSEPIRALQTAREAQQLNLKCNSSSEAVKIILLFARIYKSQGDREAALNQFLNASRLDESEEPSFTTFEILNGAALLHYEYNNYRESIALLNKAIQTYTAYPNEFKERSQKIAVMGAYNTLGLAQRNLKDYESAVQNFKRSRRLAEELDHKFWFGLTNGNLGTVFFRQNKFDSAKYFLSLDSWYSKQYKQWESLMRAYLTQANIAELEARQAVAEKYYDSIHAVLKANPSINFPPYYQNLAELHYKRGNFKIAADLYKQLNASKETMTKAEASKNLAAIQTRYEFDKKLAAMELLKKDNEIKSKELSLQKGLLFRSISTVLLLILLIYFVARRYHQKRKVAKTLEEQIIKRTRELTELNDELDTFLYRASHDLRGPLSTLLGLNQVGMLTVKDDQAIELLSKVADVANVMDKMLNKIAAIHVINREALTIERVHLHDLCDEIIDTVNCNPDICKVVNAIDKNLAVKSDPRLLKITLENIIENAVKFKKYDIFHTVAISGTTVSTGAVTVSVTDSGKGIHPEFKDKIFLPFVRADNEYKGNGLGLFLVKKCLSKIGGEIMWESKLGTGSTFTVRIPNLSAEYNLYGASAF